MRNKKSSPPPPSAEFGRLLTCLLFHGLELPCALVQMYRLAFPDGFNASLFKAVWMLPPSVSWLVVCLHLSRVSMFWSPDPASCEIRMLAHLPQVFMPGITACAGSHVQACPPCCFYCESAGGILIGSPSPTATWWPACIFLASFCSRRTGCLREQLC